MRAWLGLVVPVWIALIVCAWWEPVMHDGWDHAWCIDQRPLSVGHVVDLVDENWHYNNPRLGQTFTRVLYASQATHAVVTPLLVLATILMLVTLVLGRPPSVRRADDAYLALLVTGGLFACCPQIGPLVVYRAFVGNYTFGLALNLLWLVPYRLHVASPPHGTRNHGQRWWLAPPMLALGVLAGMCNEHTGLAFAGLGLAAIVASRRSLRVWMFAGLVGLAVGYWLLLVAPGQDVRYNGLAQQAGMLERIVDRGAGNARIPGVLLLYLLPALPLAAAALWSRTAMPRELVRVLVALALAGLACQLALLASPKIGPRLYFAAIALCVTALAGWAHARASGRVRIVLGALAGIVIAFVLVRLVTTYRSVAEAGAERLEIVRRAPRGATVVVPALGHGASRYFLGDELEREPQRNVGIGYGVTIRLGP